MSYRYICVEKKSLQNKSLMCFKIWTSWRPYPMKIKIPIGRAIFLILCAKVSISGCDLETNFEVFITFVWVYF